MRLNWKIGGWILLGEISKFSGKDDWEPFGLPRILVIGCGYAGNNIVNRLAHLGLKGGKTVAVNDDSRQLALIEADRKMLIKKKLGHYFGDIENHETERWLNGTRSIFEDALKDMDLIFITTDLSGGTGKNVASIAAEISKRRGALVAVIVTTSNRDNASKISANKRYLNALRQNADTLIVMDNNRLLRYLPFEETFSVVDQMIAETIKGITETITQPSLINLDFADVKTIMQNGGASLMFVGEADLSDGPENVVKMILGNPLLDVDYNEVTGCLLHITGGLDLKLEDATKIAGSLTQKLSPKANVIWGARIRPEFERKIKLTIIATNVKSTHILPQK